MATTVRANTRIYPVCLLIPLNPHPPPTPISTISLSSSMLTCKTPPHAVPSKQPVKLMVDWVERHAPVLFTYNQDPIINSIQPSRSFVRLERQLSSMCVLTCVELLLKITIPAGQISFKVVLLYVPSPKKRT